MMTIQYSGPKQEGGHTVFAFHEFLHHKHSTHIHHDHVHQHVRHFHALAPQPVGMTTPGSGIKIEKRNLKGVDSFGMLCSAHDIGWSKQADGVLVVLPDDSEVGSAVPDKAPKVGGLGSRSPLQWTGVYWQDIGIVMHFLQDPLLLYMLTI